MSLQFLANSVVGMHDSRKYFLARRRGNGAGFEIRTGWHRSMEAGKRARHSAWLFHLSWRRFPPESGVLTSLVVTLVQVVPPPSGEPVAVAFPVVGAIAPGLKTRPQRVGGLPDLLISG